jgi:hypothetical protein
MKSLPDILGIIIIMLLGSCAYFKSERDITVSNIESRKKFYANEKEYQCELTVRQTVIDELGVEYYKMLKELKK